MYKRLIILVLLILFVCMYTSNCLAKVGVSLSMNMNDYLEKDSLAYEMGLFGKLNERGKYPVCFSFSKLDSFERSDEYRKKTRIELKNDYFMIKYANEVNGLQDIYNENIEDTTLGISFGPGFIPNLYFTFTYLDQYLYIEGYRYWKDIILGTDLVWTPYEIDRAVMDYLEIMFDNRFPSKIEAWEYGMTYNQDCYLYGFDYNFSLNLTKKLSLTINLLARADFEEFRNHIYEYRLQLEQGNIQLEYLQRYSSLSGDLEKNVSAKYLIYLF